MDILDLEFFVEVQYDIFKILSPNNIYRSLPSSSQLTRWETDQDFKVLAAQIAIAHVSNRRSHEMRNRPSVKEI